MSEPAYQSERRSEVRQTTPADRISWVRERATRTCAGWVSNVSPSGIALIAPTRDRPTPGERIELTFDPESRAPRYKRVQVVRTAPYDRFFSVIGCMEDFAEERAGNLREAGEQAG